MGQILDLLRGSHDVEKIIVDFDNATPSDDEKELWTQINEVLSSAQTILQRLIDYKGCEDAIRKAITSPSQETEAAAWEAVVPAVDELRDFYEYSTRLESIFPNLLVALCAEDPKHTLANKQALAKQLGDVFDFVLRFDDAKMVNPAIQNDFSYYRRTLSRMKLAKQDSNIKIRDDLANKMSLFYAFPTPMMRVLSTTSNNFLSNGSNNVSKENVTTILASMANICRDTVTDAKEKGTNMNEHTAMLLLRAMTGAIILYDHTSELGAFHKKSPINVRACITLLKTHDLKPTGLVNALRFTTVHLNDPETPDVVKQMLQ